MVLAVLFRSSSIVFAFSVGLHLAVEVKPIPLFRDTWVVIMFFLVG